MESFEPSKLSILKKRIKSQCTSTSSNYNNNDASLKIENTNSYAPNSKNNNMYLMNTEATSDNIGSKSFTNHTNEINSVIPARSSSFQRYLSNTNNDLKESMINNSKIPNVSSRNKQSSGNYIGIDSHIPTESQILKSVFKKEDITIGNGEEVTNNTIPTPTVKWSCKYCNNECIPIMRESRCLCGHRLKEHSAKTNGSKQSLSCNSKSCRCKNFFYLVAEGSWILKCRCKHKHIEHNCESAPYPCQKCTICKGFDSPWVCNCGHNWNDHQQTIDFKNDKSNNDEMNRIEQITRKQFSVRRDGYSQKELDILNKPL